MSRRSEPVRIGSCRGRSILAWASVCGALLIACGAADSAADGFHNAALMTRSLEQWVADVKQAIPQLGDQLGSSQLETGRDLNRLRELGRSPSRGQSAPRGSIQSELTPQQQALLARKANDCLEILAYMHPNNIIPREFPDFQLSKIPDYRSMAKRLLIVMGPMGTNLVAERIRAERMRAPGFSGMVVHGDYQRDLQEVLTKGIKSSKLPDLIQMLDQTEDRGLKERIRKAIVEAISEAGVAELLSVQSQTTDSGLKAQIRRAIVKALPDASVAELLSVQSQTTDSSLRRSLRLRLDRINPTFKEISDSLPDLFKLAASEDRYVAATARKQLANAFVRAPMRHCLYHLGEVGPSQQALIWEQIDVKVGRADASRRAGYVETATQVLASDDWSMPSRTAALRLLSRMKDRKAAKPLIDVLVKLPRDLWAPSGQLLRDLTGQDFGPKPGDQIAAVLSAQKKWQAWWKEHGEE